MSVSSTEHLDKLAFILYDRPAGRNIIGYAIEHIEQLRADLATQQGCCDGAASQDAHIRQEREEHRAEAEKLRAEIERLRDEDTKTRHALKGWVFVCPDGGDEPTHERVSAVVAEIERLQAENKILFAQVERLADLLPNPCEEWYSVFAEKMVKERDAALAEVDRQRAEIERMREALRFCACACSSIRECVSEGAKDGKCPHLIARKALEDKP